MRDTGFYTRDSFDYQSVEVYKGPASTLFGRGSTGGVINQVSKLPQLYPIESGIATVGTNQEYRGSADVNYVIGDNAAFRINAMDMTAHVTDRDDARIRRWGIAPSVAVGLDTPTTATLSYLHQYEDNTPDFGIPFHLFRRSPRRSRATLTTACPPMTARNRARRYRHRHDQARFRPERFRSPTRRRWGNYYFDTRQTSPIYGDANCYTGAAPFAGGPVCTGAPG